MLCYRDMTFCGSPTCEGKCGRKLTEEVREAAKKWWGSDDAPIAVSDFCTQLEQKEAHHAPHAASLGA